MKGFYKHGRGSYCCEIKQTMGARNNSGKANSVKSTENTAFTSRKSNSVVRHRPTPHPVKHAPPRALCAGEGKNELAPRAPRGRGVGGEGEPSPSSYFLFSTFYFLRYSIGLPVTESKRGRTAGGVGPLLGAGGFGFDVSP